MPLFDRHARGVEPTWYGQVLIRRARAALSEIGRAHDEIAALASGRMGQAAIGTVVNPGTTLVPQAIAEVKRDFPDILIKVEMDYSRPLVAKLLDGQLDIVIGRIMGPEGAAELDFEPLADEPHSVIVRAGHPLLLRGKRQPCRPGRLRLDHAAGGQRAALAPGCGIPGACPAAAAEHHRNRLAAGDHPLAAAQRHVDGLAGRIGGPYLQTGQMLVLPIELGVRMECFGIIRRRDQQLSPGAERVLEALADDGAQDLSGAGRRVAAGNIA